MPNILIIDDQPHLQELFSQDLADEGYGVVGIADAEAAKRYFRDSKPDLPDLVLLDLYLDGFEGWDLLRR
ncbi:response regulator [Thermodesulfobacteriota bacterium]